MGYMNAKDEERNKRIEAADKFAAKKARKLVSGLVKIVKRKYKLDNRTTSAVIADALSSAYNKHK